MQTEELRNLVRKIQNLQCETQTIEVKAAYNGCPTRLFDTLSGFSNQDEGGIIVFGLDENKNYEVCGVYDPQDLQKRVTEQCKQMEPIIRPLFTVFDVDKGVVVTAEIPGADISERPVFYRGVGRIRGSYIRTGESDELMSEYEIYSYDAYRKRVRDELRPAIPGKYSLLNGDLLEHYLNSVKQDRKNLSDNLSDDEILEAMGITTDKTPTLAGLMIFSAYPQAIFPQLCITAVAVPGTKIGETGENEERFLDNQRFTGSLSVMLEDSVAFVRRNSRTMTIIDSDGKRTDKSEYPARAVREAILNALVHRDYSKYSETVPIRIVMYSDRMEIINNGGLYGYISIDSLGKVRPDTRNPALANILELLAVTENRYSGIPTIQNEFLRAGLPAPEFRVNRGEFIVTFRNRMQKNKKDIKTELLDFSGTPRTRDELTEFTGFSQYYTMSKLVAPLVEEGKIELTIPDKPKSKNQKYKTVEYGKKDPYRNNKG